MNKAHIFTIIKKLYVSFAVIVALTIVAFSVSFVFEANEENRAADKVEAFEKLADRKFIQSAVRSAIRLARKEKLSDWEMRRLEIGSELMKRYPEVANEQRLIVEKYLSNPEAAPRIWENVPRREEGKVCYTFNGEPIYDEKETCWRTAASFIRKNLFLESLKYLGALVAASLIFVGVFYWARWLVKA